MSKIRTSAMRAVGAVLAGTALVVGVAGGSASAAAGEPITAHAASPGEPSTTGAKALFNWYNDVLTVCDTRRDGRRAVARAYNKTTRNFVAYVEDKDGANGCTGSWMGWKAFDTPVRRGDRISLELWIQDGRNGGRENYRQTEFISG
ncbi:hypothetical protein ACGFMM_24820 [Streptomyces sp. NPDC048604]|uniref:hypothetical protein n=1 Tax=Streptomyces sp. NPDC048604 TaxID=3365578 RepID=UPI00371D89F7